MEFKSAVWTMGPEEYESVYKNLSCRANNRPTDLNGPSVDYIISQLDPSAENLLDVGCGRGFFLNHLARSGIKIAAHGTDIYDNVPLEAATYTQGRVESLPFPDRSFDIVVCTHTLEHIVEIDRAIAELKRVCRKQLLVVVPCQREYRYTLDLHVHFFPNSGKLEGLLKLPRRHCRKILGDWVCVGWMCP
jgi:SAM-dependent methyltransferase